MSGTQLDQIAAMSDGFDRCAAAVQYLQRGSESLTAARKVRDLAITELLAAGHGQADIAARTGCSLSHVKLVKKISEGNQ